MPDPKPINILLVEDDEVDVMTVRRAFEKARTPVAITEAQDGREALTLLQNETLPEPRIILLDLNMPRMNGIEFLQQLRSKPELESETVFILTTSKADEDRLAAYSFNVTGYIIKAGVEDFRHNLVTEIDRHFQ